MQNYKKYHLPISYWYYEICATIENTPEPHPKSVSTVQEDSIDKWKLHITQTEWQYRKLAQKQVFISDHVCSLQSRILQWVASPPPGDLPNPGSNPGLLCLLQLAGEFFTTSTIWEAPRFWPFWYKGDFPRGSVWCKEQAI